MPINSKIILDSVSEDGVRITTWELEYPRFIHAELMTHRVFSRNAASSRAIPIEKTIEQVLTNPAKPEEWGYNQAGMQAKKVMTESYKIATANYLWSKVAKVAVIAAKALEAFGLHKQIVNRVLEPFVHIKVVVTSTEWNNWYHLRNHLDAQPEIRILAKQMFELKELSKPNLLMAGEWHLPYLSQPYTEDGVRVLENDAPPYNMLLESVGGLENAIKISSSCCAQVSYRTLDTSLDKAIKIYDRLVNMNPVHASPFEHQAKVMSSPKNEDYEMFQNWEDGVTHVDRDNNLWSGNLRGWVQNRQLIPNHVVNG